MRLTLAVCVLLAGCWPRFDNELHTVVGHALSREESYIYEAERQERFEDAQARINHLRSWAATIPDSKIRNAYLWDLSIEQNILEGTKRDAKLIRSMPVPPPYVPLASKPGL